MPQYIKYEDVKIRLQGKVRFDDAPGHPDENKMPKALALRLIDEAEGQVEQDLSPRYLAPFVDTAAGTYLALPDRPTKNIIRNLCELQSVIRLLETDFGSGSAVDGQKYQDKLEKRYRKIIDDTILAKFGAEYESSRQWKYPPMPGLKLNYFNTESDDGYAGYVSVTNSDEGNYAAQQIDDPSETFFNAQFDDSIEHK